MAKKMRNGLTQKQRKTQVRRVADAIDIYEIRPNRPMTENWEDDPDPCSTKTRQTRGGGPDARMGLVTVEPLAGEGATTSTVCNLCGETNGHAGWCPVISVGGAS